MNQEIQGRHNTDEDGNPAGGETVGTGIRINWQNGPLGRGDERVEQNGAFVEGVISAAIDRLNFYQDSKFKCSENHDAILLLGQALDSCNERTAEREERAVEGTHEV